jgi:CheY-like chemotaxis protein
VTGLPFVLVVDDNATNIAVYERVLSAVPGCLPKCFTDPSAALHWAERQHPALAIVDYRMPEGMDGFEFIRALRKIPGNRGVPCVVLTADKSVREEAAALGVVAFLTKPARKDDILTLVRRYVIDLRDVRT